jgi:glutathione S-transferase
MHPANALVRARHRGWIEAASATIADVFGLYMAPDAVGLERKAADLQSRCRALEVALSPQGPWFDGTDFALVDAAWAPVFRLFDTLEPLAGIAPGAACPTLARYRAALAQRPSVQAAAGPDYGKHFEAYLRQRGSHLSRLMASVPA